MSGYLRARTLEEALEARAARPLTVLAGGTDVYPAHTARVAWGRMARPDILDIGGLVELHGISDDGDRIRIGALATWSEIARAGLPPVFDGLRAAAREIGGAQIQNRGTLAGNLCTASPAGDGIPCLMSLDASVELASVRGRRTVPVEAFNHGYRATLLSPDEIVTALTVPRGEQGEAGAFLKLGARRYLVISIAMVAGTLALDAAGRIARVRIAVGACAPAARRLRALEARLAGLDPDTAAATVTAADLQGLSPIDDIRASADYRLEAARALVGDLLADLSGSLSRRAA
ncbi:MAG TPA: FAD binding domain-containing protein [Methylomirabilota bacterium]|nr:FAD binding domain-containing protein [Methylomirabilota bacterium]